MEQGEQPRRKKGVEGGCKNKKVYFHVSCLTTLCYENDEILGSLAAAWHSPSDMARLWIDSLCISRRTLAIYSLLGRTLPLQFSHSHNDVLKINKKPNIRLPGIESVSLQLR
jgi:hypothetical protein